MILSSLFIIYPHVAFLAGLAAIYALFHTSFLLSFQLQGLAPCPVYDFLSLDGNLFPVVIIGLLVAQFIVYALTFGISKIKECCFGKPERITRYDERTKPVIGKYDY